MAYSEDVRAWIEKSLSEQPGLIPRERFAYIIGKSRRTLANRDSDGTGVSNPIRCGNHILYTKEACIDWLVAQATR
jgi:hypothetical protein